MKNYIVFYISLFALLAIAYDNFGQKISKFSLAEAQEYAIQNSYEMQNARKDIEIAKKRVSEITALGFPQLNANLTYTNYIDIPTSLIPGEFFGQ